MVSDSSILRNLGRFSTKQTVSKNWKPFKTSKNITIRNLLGIFGLRKPICNFKKSVKCFWDHLRNTSGIKILGNPFFGFLECENFLEPWVRWVAWILWAAWISWVSRIYLNSTRTLYPVNSLGSVSSLGFLGFVNFCSNSWKSIDVWVQSSSKILK